MLPTSASSPKPSSRAATSPSRAISARRLLPGRRWRERPTSYARLDQVRKASGVIPRRRVAAPLHGYFWRLHSVAACLRGSDSYADGVASMTWQLLGLVPVIHTSGPDVARSAIGGDRKCLATHGAPPTPRRRLAGPDDHHLVADVPIQKDEFSLQSRSMTAASSTRYVSTAGATPTAPGSSDGAPSVPRHRSVE